MNVNTERRKGQRIGSVHSSAAGLTSLVTDVPVGGDGPSQPRTPTVPPPKTGGGVRGDQVGLAR